MAGGYSNDMAGGARPVPITGQGVAGMNCTCRNVHFVHFKCVSVLMLSLLHCASHPFSPLLRRHLQHPTGYAAATATTAAAASVWIRSSSNGRIWQRLQRGSW